MYGPDRCAICNDRHPPAPQRCAPDDMQTAWYGCKALSGDAPGKLVTDRHGFTHWQQRLLIVGCPTGRERQLLFILFSYTCPSGPVAGLIIEDLSRGGAPRTTEYQSTYITSYTGSLNIGRVRITRSGSAIFDSWALALCNMISI